MSLRKTHRHQHWLINARSGNGAGQRLLRALPSRKGVTASPINFETIDEQVSTIPFDDMIVVAGGDGTFSSVLGRSSLGSRPVACIPLGTANDLTREIGISRMVKGVAPHNLPNVIEGLSTRPFSVWEISVNDTTRPFVNYVSIGYEGAVVADFDAWRKRVGFSRRVINRAAYAIFGMRYAFTRIRGLSITTESNPGSKCPPTTGLIVTNIKSHLGLGLSNAESSPYDSILECISVPTVLGFASMMGASLGILSPPRVHTKGASLRITGIPVNTPLQIDGECCPPVTGGFLECHLKHFVQLCVAT